MPSSQWYPRSTVEGSSRCVRRLGQYFLATRDQDPPYLEPRTPPATVYHKSLNRSLRLLLVQLSQTPACNQGPASISTSSLQQTDGRQHVTAVSLNKQYTNVQKVDSQAEPTFETRLVIKARLLLVQSSQSRIYGTHSILPDQPRFASFLLDSPSPFVLDLCIFLGQTKAFHILSSTIPPCPSQTEGDSGRTEKWRHLQLHYKKISLPWLPSHLF